VLKIFAALQLPFNATFTQKTAQTAFKLGLEMFRQASRSSPSLLLTTCGSRNQRRRLLHQQQTSRR
jgi:hypothetical protein